MADKNKKMTWADVQTFLSELGLEEQIRLAELKGVEVPAEVKAQASALAAKGQVEIHYGSKNDPGRHYLTFTEGCPSGGKTTSGQPRRGRAVFLTLQTLDGEIARLQAAREMLVAAGFPTTPNGGEVPTPDAARKAGFRVVDKRG